jgi:hypothetical protein
VQAGIQEADHHGQPEEHLHEAAGRIEAAVRRGGAGGEKQAGGDEGEAHGFGAGPVQLWWEPAQHSEPVIVRMAR